MIYTFPKFDWSIFDGAIFSSFAFGPMKGSKCNHCFFVLNTAEHKIQIIFDGYFHKTLSFDETLSIVSNVSLSQTLGYILSNSVCKNGGDIKDYQQLFIECKTSGLKQELTCAVKNLTIIVD